MTCQDLEPVIDLYLDGEFQLEDRLAAERHLAECPSCFRRMDYEGRARQTVRRVAIQTRGQIRAPQELRSRLQGHFRQERRRAAQAVWLRMGAAALVLVTAGGGAWRMFRPENRQRYMDDAVRRHAKRLPVEVAGGSHENLEAWFDGKLDHHVSVPRLHDVQLSGARISNVTDRPAAYISYERSSGSKGTPARRIGLFVFDDAQREVEAPTLPAVQVGSSQGYNVAVWREGEIVYELVSDLNEEDIRYMLAEQSANKAAPTSPPPPPVLPVLLQP